jgi:hypothetical protein
MYFSARHPSGDPLPELAAMKKLERNSANAMTKCVFLYECTANNEEKKLIKSGFVPPNLYVFLEQAICREPKQISVRTRADMCCDLEQTCIWNQSKHGWEPIKDMVRGLEKECRNQSRQVD